MLYSSVHCHFLPTEITNFVYCTILPGSCINQDKDLTPLIIQDSARPLPQKRYDQEQTFNNLIFLALCITADVLQYNIDQLVQFRLFFIEFIYD